MFRGDNKAGLIKTGPGKQRGAQGTVPDMNSAHLTILTGHHAHLDEASTHAFTAEQVLARTHETREDGEGDESDAESDPSSDAAERAEAMEDDLQFSERTLPPEPFDFYYCSLYLVFLVLFCIVTIGRQGAAPFLLAKFARDQIGHDQFMDVDNTIAYMEWLECESVTVHLPPAWQHQHVCGSY